ncbi:hypothetical protein TWF481_008240 [Arthrobotrys musiformis]|uniref:Uncharacterized protein n=1 Tax=Arthrobotrys musiformis TaxID=47236 RepID=A0AAV9W7L6_9PEZI
MRGIQKRVEGDIQGHRAAVRDLGNAVVYGNSIQVASVRDPSNMRMAQRQRKTEPLYLRSAGTGVGWRMAIWDVNLGGFGGEVTRKQRSKDNSETEVCDRVNPKTMNEENCKWLLTRKMQRQGAIQGGRMRIYCEVKSSFRQSRGIFRLTRGLVSLV